MSRVRLPEVVCARMDAMPPLKKRMALLAIVIAIGLLARFLYYVGLGQNACTAAVENDSITYYAPGMALAHTGVFHSEARTPGYPLLLAAVYAVSGDPNPISEHNLHCIFLTQALLWLLCCIPLYDAILRLTREESLAALGALSWAIYYPGIVYTFLVLSEVEAAVMVCLLAYSVARAVQEDRPLWFAAIGLCLFMLPMVRPAFLALAPAVWVGLLGYVWFIRRERRLAAFGLLSVLVLVLPLSVKSIWTYRNQVVEHKAYFCRLGMLGLWETYTQPAVEEAQGRTEQECLQQAATNEREFRYLLPRMSPEAMDRMYVERILHDLRQSPGAMFRFFLRHAPGLLKPERRALGLPDAGPLLGGRYRQTLQPSYWRQLSGSERLGLLIALLLSPLHWLVLVGSLLLIIRTALPRYRPGDPVRRGFLLVTGPVLAYSLAIFTCFGEETRYFLPMISFLLVAAAAAPGGLRLPPEATHSP